ncbi:tRNA epoxyqueuosine(34) reductase QueG [Agaribacterium haliotis]|uniref:tRNA epoxyqueuosine(34) reductase QueG n=1 Tax=Agaribacterium haliotis TaxID=2013869 RepID=UPI000BB58879|nr:tRNA epoxyqueuosine(34) reductase QueG [Agaribacterium haliotis]
MCQTDYRQLLEQIELWSTELGFSQWAVSDLELKTEEQLFKRWLERNYHGSMSWLANNVDKRLCPPELVPGSCRVISVALNYRPADTREIDNLKQSNKAYISRYALGRDYHKLMRKRLAKLGKLIESYVEQHKLGPTAHSRAFVDSAPVLERPLAAKAGLGWIGKHTLVLNKEAGSWFFLGELFTNLPLPASTQTVAEACGSCEACLKVCPTDAFIKPWLLDARRCISYLTIEHDGAIPLELREAIGNRIYGCDDCQLICPWSKESKLTEEQDFQPRSQLFNQDLLTLFRWTEQQFLQNTEGSAIRRAGYEKWRRNLAVALGNAEQDLRIQEALKAALPDSSALLAEHISWALAQQEQGKRRKRKSRNGNKALELAYWPDAKRQNHSE